ncbi:MAG: AarF/ABC1/UbiB kinase family protein [Bdellovibrio sp.]|nr:AarF/ABC1/UbiB kinase family protein [Bdellovibrio sp.]
MNLGKYLPSRLAAYAESQSEITTPERMRKACEELGPTFVKLGQLLSTRSDILSEEFIIEFTKLQDNVFPLKYELIKNVVENELGKKIEEAFSFFDQTPLASASIAQAHEARLPSGEKVVIKVQKPGIDKIIGTDISLLAFLAGLLERYIPESRVFNPKIIVDEFFKTLSYELNFYVEANNIIKMTQNLSSIPEIIIPKIFENFSTEKILTLQKIEGLRVNDIQALDRAGIDRKQICAIGTRAFFKSVMIDGLFHGDLHGGNLFVLPGNKLGIIDFGIVGRLSQKSRDQLVDMVTCILTEDYENLCYQYAELGQSSASIEFDSFHREVQNTLSPYMGLSLEKINVGKILIEATKIATRFDIKIPGDWMIVFKSIVTMEGMGRILDPNFDLLSHGKELIKDLSKNQYSMQRITKDLLWVAKDTTHLLQALPRQLKWMFRKWSSNDFAFEVKSPELTKIREQLDINGKRMSLTILVTGFFIAGALSLQYVSDQKILNYPIVSVILFALGGFILIRLLLKSIK